MDRVKLYCRALEDLGDEQLEYGFGQALKYLRDFLPGPGEIRYHAELYREDESAAILARGAKPDDWIEDDAEREEYVTAIKSEIRARIAAGAFALPPHRETAEMVAAERNGKSQVPVDPKARREWFLKELAERRAKGEV